MREEISGATDETESNNTHSNDHPEAIPRKGPKHVMIVIQNRKRFGTTDDNSWLSFVIVDEVIWLLPFLIFCFISDEYSMNCTQLNATCLSEGLENE